LDAFICTTKSRAKDEIKSGGDERRLSRGAKCVGKGRLHQTWQQLTVVVTKIWDSPIYDADENDNTCCGDVRLIYW